MNKIKLWLEATRAETLLASLSPMVIGAVIASQYTQINISVLIFTFIYGLLLHVGTNLSNDYYDFIKGADTDERIAPFSTIQKGTTSLKKINIAFSICFLLAFLIGLLFILRGGIIVALLFTLPIIFGYFYTAGTKPLGYIGLGEILVLLFFGPFACLGTYYLQTLQISILPIIAGLGPGFLSIAILVVNNLRDIDVDKKANKNTLAVRFGKKFAQTEYSVCIFLAFLVPYLYFILSKKPLILSCSSFILLTPFKDIYKFKNPSILNDGLKKTVLLLVIYTIIFCLFLSNIG